MGPKGCKGQQEQQARDRQVGCGAEERPPRRCARRKDHIGGPGDAVSLVLVKAPQAARKRRAARHAGYFHHLRLARLARRPDLDEGPDRAVILRESQRRDPQVPTGDDEPFPIISDAIHPHQGSGAHEIPIHVRIVSERKGGERLVSQGADRQSEDPGTQRQDEREPRQGSEQARHHRFPDGEQAGSDGPVIATPAA